MKKIIITVTFLIAFGYTALAQVGIGTTTPQATLDIQGDKGILLPRMADHTTLVPIDGTLDASEKGLMVFNTTLNKLYIWDGTAWVEGIGIQGPQGTPGSDDITANNGVTKTGTNVALGGALTGNTTITTGDFNMVVRKSGSTTSSLLVNGNSGNVGIGTNSPNAALDVKNTTIDTFNATTNPDLAARLATNTSNAGGIIQAPELGHLVLGIRDNNGDDGFHIMSGGGNYDDHNTYTTSVASFNANGNVGIGIAEPTHKLHVRGSIRVGSADNSAGFITEAGLGGIGLAGAGVPARLNNPDLYVTDAGNVGIGTTTAQATLDIQGDKGILLPRMADHTTLVPVDGTLDASEKGLMVFNTTLNKLYIWDGTAWVEGIGIQGPAGADGAVGPQGPMGPQGNDGLAGADGAVGPQGPAGNNGAVGPTGPQGPMGPQGNDGLAGADGAVGPTGPQGNEGPAGADGATGPQGPQGTPGSDDITANNGVTKTGTNIALGGALTGNTTITTGDFNMVVRKSGSTAPSFRVNGDSGNVGIGITEPTQKLHVRGSIRVGSADNSAGFITEAGLGGIGLAGAGVPARLNNPDLYVTDAGNVGIGTTTAQETLHVNGTTRIDNLPTSGNTDRGVTVDANGVLKAHATNVQSKKLILYRSNFNIGDSFYNGNYITTNSWVPEISTNIGSWTVSNQGGTQGGFIVISVTFISAFPDTNYMVLFNIANEDINNRNNNNDVKQFIVEQKRTTGFNIVIEKTSNATQTFNWINIIAKHYDTF